MHRISHWAIRRLASKFCLPRNLKPPIVLHRVVRLHVSRLSTSQVLCTTAPNPVTKLSSPIYVVQRHYLLHSCFRMSSKKHPKGAHRIAQSLKHAHKMRSHFHSVGFHFAPLHMSCALGRRMCVKLHDFLLPRFSFQASVVKEGAQSSVCFQRRGLGLVL